MDGNPPPPGCYPLSMRTMSTRVMVLVLAGSTCGCRASHKEPDRTLIESRYSSLDVSDGVSRDEAIVVAQHYMLSKGRDFDWFIDVPNEVTDSGDDWEIIFKNKNDGWG